MAVLMANAPLLWQHLRVNFTQKRSILLRKSERSTVTPNCFLRIMLQTQTNIDQHYAQLKKIL